MYNLIKKFQTLSLSIFLFVLSVSPVFAGTSLGDWQEVLDTGAGSQGAGYRTDIQSPEPIIATIINVALSFLGVIFLVLMIYGGYLWMTARGNQDQVTKAKDLITAAIIGLVLVLVSYVIAEFVVGALTENTLE